MTQDSEEYLKSLKKWAHDNFGFDDVDYPFVMAVLSGLFLTTSLRTTITI